MHAATAPKPTSDAVGCLFDVACSVGESPYWHAETNSLWWVDAGGQALYRGCINSGEVELYAVDVAPSFIAGVDEGAVLLAGDRGWYVLNLSDRKLSQLAEPSSGPSAQWRMNDGVIDGAGRVWTGSIGLPRNDASFGALYRWDQGGIHQLVDDLVTQNGLAISPDGQTLYLADSHPSRACVWAFDLDAESGDISNRRIFHSCARGRPDGAAMDCHGGYWLALIDAAAVIRLDPDGTITHTVALPISRPTNICFGGPDMRQCFVTSMRAGLEPDALINEPGAGAVFTFEAPIRGMPQPLPDPTLQPWQFEATRTASH